MLHLARTRAAVRPLRAAAYVRTVTSGSGTTPDTGGPLFSSQYGVPIHKPAKGGDQAAEVKEKKEQPPHKGPTTSGRRIAGGYSFSELKRLHNDGRD